MDRTIYLIVTMLLVIYINSKLDELKSRQGRIERKLDLVLKNLEIDFIDRPDISDELRQELIEEILENGRIKATKLLRESQELDLLQAKTYIDQLADEIENEKTPNE